MCSAKVCADELDATQILMYNQSACANVSKSTKLRYHAAALERGTVQCASRFSLLASQSCGHRKLYSSSIVVPCASAQRKLNWYWKGDLFKTFDFTSAFSIRFGIVLGCERNTCHIYRIYCRRTARISALNFFNGCTCHPNLLGACISTG